MTEQERIAALAKQLGVSERTAAMIDPADVVLNDVALRIEKETGCSFGEALREARQRPEVMQAFSESAPRMHPIVSQFAERNPALRGIDHVLDPDSLILNAQALEIEKTRKVEFGEALRCAVAEFSERQTDLKAYENTRDDLAGRAEARNQLFEKEGINPKSIAAGLIMEKAANIEKSDVDRETKKSRIPYAKALSQAHDNLKAAGWPMDGKTDKWNG